MRKRKKQFRNGRNEKRYGIITGNCTEVFGNIILKMYKIQVQ